MARPAPRRRTREEYRPFAKWFRNQLWQAGLGQTGFANLAKERSGVEVSPATVGTWWRAEHRPSPEMCDVIAEVLGLPRDVVLAEAGYRKLPAPEEMSNADIAAEYLRMVRITPSRLRHLRNLITHWQDDDREADAGQATPEVREPPP